MMSVYEDITNRFLAEIEKGVLPWRKTWTVAGLWAISHATGKPYSFLNSLLCGHGEFVTFAGAKKEGGHVNKGAKARDIFIPMTFIPEREKEKPENEQKSVLVFKKMCVFHLDDTTGLKQKVKPEDKPKVEPIEEAEKIVADYIARSGLTLEIRESERAYYDIGVDVVVCPMREQFSDIAEYYAVLFHELAHSTVTKSRLNRDVFCRKGDKDYSREELVAEFTTTIILTKLGIDTPSTWANSASYLKGWARAFNDDAKMITWAASKAEKAANLILGVAEESD